MNKKFLVIALIIVVTISSSVFAKTFVDVPENHWAYESINLMEQKGILSGYPDGTFLPNKYITKTEFAKILVLSLGLTEDDVYSYEKIKEMVERYGETYELGDINQNFWGYEYINLAFDFIPYYKKEGKVFVEPNATINREDVAEAIVLALGFDVSKHNLGSLKIFSDENQISENKKSCVAIAVEHGIMNGNANGTFNPKGYLTRAEVSKLFYNVYSNFEEIQKEINIFLKISDMYSKVEISQTREEVIKNLGEPDEILDRFSEVLSWTDGERTLLEVAIGNSDGKVNQKRMGYLYSSDNVGETLNATLEDLDNEISKIKEGMTLDEVKAILGDAMLEWEQILLNHQTTYIWYDKKEQSVKITFLNGVVWTVGFVI